MGMPSCHLCKNELPATAQVRRTDGCPTCHADLKCCLNCRLHDPGASNQCREPQAEWVTEKDKANFCEFFELGDRSARRTGSSRAAFDALFGKQD